MQTNAKQADCDGPNSQATGLGAREQLTASVYVLKVGLEEAAKTA